MELDGHDFPYQTLFKKYVSDLSAPDQNGWASGSCPFCGEAGTFRVNLQSGRWVCLPTPNHLLDGNYAGTKVKKGDL